jgi:hypothetical protein
MKRQMASTKVPEIGFIRMHAINASYGGQYSASHQLGPGFPLHGVLHKESSHESCRGGEGGMVELTN